MKLLWSVFLILSCFIFGHSQGWERIMGSPDYQDYGRTITQLSDGSFIAGGWTYGTDQSFGKPGNYVVKLTSTGVAEWVFTTNNSLYSQVHDIIETSDGNYLVSSSDGGYIYLIKLSQNGTVLWEKKPSAEYLPLKATSILESSDGGFVFTGKVNHGSGNFNAYVYKVDQNGDFMWYSSIGDASFQTGVRIVETSGGYVICGESSNAENQLYLAKVDFNGSVLWEKNYESSIVTAQALKLAADGCMYVCGTKGDSIQNIYIMKIDSVGDSLWFKHYEENVNSQGVDLDLRLNGEILVLNNINISGGLYSPEVRAYNAEGEILWSKQYGSELHDYGSSLISTSDGGFAFAGITHGYGFTDGQVYVVKADGNENTFSNYISGKLFDDKNSDCAQDNDENGLHRLGNQHWMVKVIPGPFGNEAFYATTEADGSYEIACAPGEYTISGIPINASWLSTCTNKHVSFSDVQQSSENNDFGFVPDELCSKLVVDITSSRIRQCRDAIYYIGYCNNGTASAGNSIIEIELPTEYIPTGSTMSWNSSVGNLYTFNIGNLNSGECGTFRITGTFSCDVEIQQTLCARAEIFPGDECEEVDPDWDRSSVQVTGSCNGDTAVCFIITNTGEEAMDSWSVWRLYSNNQLAQTGGFRLGAGDSKELCFYANGETLRLEADQLPGHPGNSLPRATIELCGELSTSKGYILQVPQDDQDDHVEISCTEVTGSYDPNDKSVAPKGVTIFNYISKDQDLEYTIRFQNTGNDTAFTVRIVDTLDSDVYDIASLEMVSASHPFILQIYSSGVAEWVFDDILLPDSTVDLIGSQGYAKFKLKQKGNNDVGTRIINKAYIYFDNNAPILTNCAFNEVHDTVLVTDPLDRSGIAKEFYKNIFISLVPNPFSEYTTITISGIPDSYLYTLELMDITGRAVLVKSTKNSSFTIEKGNLKSGAYYYKISSNNKPIGVGKLIVN